MKHITNSLQKTATVAMFLAAIATDGQSMTVSDSRGQVESVANSLYGDLKDISSTATTPLQLSKLKERFDGYFYWDGLGCPNEFKTLGVQSAESYEYDIRPQRYVNLFIDMFKEQQELLFSYSIDKTKEIKGPSFTKNDYEAELVQVIVKKKYSNRRKKKLYIFSDTLVIGINDGRIHQWANKTSSRHIGFLAEEDENTSIEDMKWMADLQYSIGYYSEAYDSYVSLLKRCEKEGKPIYRGEIYYKMAIMLYQKKAEKELSGKERKKKVIDTLITVTEIGEVRDQRNAKNALYVITNGALPYN